MAKRDSRAAKYTPLGEVYYSVDEWKRKKILAELRAIGVAYDSLRAYLVITPAYRAAGDIRDIIIANIPEAAPLFERPKPQPAES